MKNTPKGKPQHLLKNKKNNDLSYSSPGLLSKIGSCFSTHKSSYPTSSTLPSKPLSHYKAYTSPSSSSSTILKKPVPKHTDHPAASKNNTDPSISEAAWALAAGAGKLAFFIGKKAAIVTTEVVKSGIEIAHNQIDHNEKLKETFVCYYTDPKRTAYQGTLYFSDNQIVFSTNHALPPHTTNEKHGILPPRSSYKVSSWIVKACMATSADISLFFQMCVRVEMEEYTFPKGMTRDSKSKVEIKIPFQEVIEINQVNAENPSARYIQIRLVKGFYAFWGFDDYYKAYNHIYSLLPSSS